MNSLFGLKLIESIYATTDEGPIRVHIKKTWMKDTYHLRIQKKWTKRFGRYLKPAAYRSGNMLICHPEVAREIRHRAKTAGY